MELRLFLGFLYYYGIFLPSLASVLHPLNDLLMADTAWSWSNECAIAFTEAEQLLVKTAVLAHFNPVLSLHLTGDASAYSVGAVISHTYPDGSECPIAFTSRTLSGAEQNYAQIEKETLSLIFGVQKFHQFLYSGRFEVVTDHKPFTTVLGPNHGIPILAAGGF